MRKAKKRRTQRWPRLPLATQIITNVSCILRRSFQSFYILQKLKLDMRFMEARMEHLYQYIALLMFSCSYRQLKRALMAPSFPTTTVTFAWETRTLTGRQVRQRSWCPAPTVGVLVSLQQRLFCSREQRNRFIIFLKKQAPNWENN